MSEYNFTRIENKWIKYWEDNEVFKVTEDEKFPLEKRLYVLDMFPYPSGSGLHVGHPEGYTATDIMFYIQWDLMLLVYLQKIMQFKQELIRRLQLKKI